MIGNHSSCARRKDLNNYYMENQQEEEEGKVAAPAAQLEGWGQGRKRKGNKGSLPVSKNGCSLLASEGEDWFPVE